MLAQGSTLKAIIPGAALIRGVEVSSHTFTRRCPGCHSETDVPTGHIRNTEVAYERKLAVSDTQTRVLHTCRF